MMENKCGTWRSIAAVASTMSAITFDVILPMLTENNGAWRAGNRFTIHAKRLELIQLFSLP